ncbi:MAG: hypothetical protein LDL41_02665 [Coleofasciculus sp. S288]|nr:hypothetical protein [Coleofasciculus sp. S288]
MVIDCDGLLQSKIHNPKYHHCPTDAIALITMANKGGYGVSPFHIHPYNVLLE